MRSLEEAIQGLPSRHREALEWFRQNAGNQISWPGPLGGTLLATRAKGIYKPHWTRFALSVRQTLDSPYPDREPVLRDDGTWLYAYFQEAISPAERDAQFTNRGMLECSRQGVPVGVMRQVSLSPSKYRILGLALVSFWDEGFFYLEGFSPEGLVREPGRGSEIEFETEKARAEAVADFDPANVTDGRRRMLAAIVRRQGQPRFRATLLRLYGCRCAMTGCDAIEALEAAHVTPYMGQETNSPQNGILLRSDVHTLYDLGLISIDPENGKAWVAERLRSGYYREIFGRTVDLPNPPQRPSVEALRTHFRWATGTP